MSQQFIDTYCLDSNTYIYKLAKMTTMKNAVLLRRAMETIGMTGVSLANALTKMRDDGKETGTATVSRWLNGASPVEPAVMCWLQDLIRAEAHKNISTKIAWNSKHSLFIGVTNLKGGVGISTIACALAILAKRDLHATVRHIRLDSADSFDEILKSLDVDTRQLAPDELKSCLPARHEIIFVDIGRFAAAQLIKSGDFANIPLDLLVVPANFASCLDLWGTKAFVEKAQTKALITLLYYTSLIDIDFSVTAASEGFDVLSDQFIPFIFPISVGEQVFPTGLTGEWPNQYQLEFFYRLFEDLLHRVGMDIADERSSRNEIENMPFDELLSMLGH